MTTRPVTKKALPQLDQLVVYAQLENSIDASVCLLLDLGERIEVPGVDDQRLLAHDVGANAQSETAMSVVQVVRRADRQPVETLALRPPPALLEVPVEAFRLSEEMDVKSVLVEKANGVLRITRR